MLTHVQVFLADESWLPVEFDHEPTIGEVIAAVAEHCDVAAITEIQTAHGYYDLEDGARFVKWKDAEHEVPHEWDSIELPPRRKVG